MMWYFKRLHQFSMHLPFVRVKRKEDEWLVYQDTNFVSPSPSSPIEHQSRIVPLPPAPHALAKPPIVQVYSRREDIGDTCSALFSSSSDPLLLDPSKNIDLSIALRKL